MAGKESGGQAGKQDVLLHETATAWLRVRLVKSGADLEQPWLETPKEFAARMQQGMRCEGSVP